MATNAAAIGELCLVRFRAGLRGAKRERRVLLLICATDVYTWQILRRDQGLTERKTAAAIRELVEALHRDSCSGESESVARVRAESTRGGTG